MGGQAEEPSEVGAQELVYFLPTGWSLGPVDSEEMPWLEGNMSAKKLTWDAYPDFWVTFSWIDPTDDPLYGGWTLESGALSKEISGTWEDYPINCYLMPWKELQLGLDQVFKAFGVNPYETEEENYAG